MLYCVLPNAATNQRDSEEHYTLLSVRLDYVISERQPKGTYACTAKANNAIDACCKLGTILILRLLELNA